MSKPNTMDTTPDNRINSQVEADSSFLDILGRSPTKQRPLFPTDHEVFVDSQYPLILINDTSTNLPFQSPFADKRNNSNNSFLETESPKRDDSLKNRGSLRRKKTIKTELKDRRVSIPLSNNTFNSKESANGRENDSQSPNKSISQEQQEEKEVDVFEIEEKEENELNAVKTILIKILDSNSFNIFIGICTIYALFAQDISLAFFHKSADFGFDVVSLFTILAFGTEIICACYAKRAYVGSFFFVLDIISTVSIFFDINFIVDDLFRPK